MCIYIHGLWSKRRGWGNSYTFGIISVEWGVLWEFHISFQILRPKVTASLSAVVTSERPVATAVPAWARPVHAVVLPTLMDACQRFVANERLVDEKSGTQELEIKNDLFLNDLCLLSSSCLLCSRSHAVLAVYNFRVKSSIICPSYLCFSYRGIDLSFMS